MEVFLSYKHNLWSGAFKRRLKVPRNCRAIWRCSNNKDNVQYHTFYPKLVEEFILNIPKEFNEAKSKKFRKVHVRGNYFGFSPTIINKYLGRGKLITADRIPPLKCITQEITRNVHKDYPCKGLLHTTSLSVKYVILNKMRVSSWCLTKHSSSITPSLFRLSYQIGTRAIFDFGERVFLSDSKASRIICC